MAAAAPETGKPLPVLYRCRDDAGTLVYLGEQVVSARGFWPRIVTVEVEWFATAADARAAARAAVQREHPEHYGKVSRTVPAWDHFTVYRCYDAAGVQLYVGSTERPASARWAEHARDRQDGRWWRQVTVMRIELYPDPKAMIEAERRAYRAEKPPHNNSGIWERHPRRYPDTARLAPAR